MKKLILLLLALTLFYANGISFSQWYQISPTFTMVLQVDFVNDLTGFAITDKTIQKTTDAGLNWFVIYAGKSHNDYPYVCMDFLDVNTGYFTGRNDIYKTTNGGYNWYVVNVYPATDYHTIKFINADTGFAGGISTFIRLRKTTDGGVSWTTRNVYGNIWDLHLFGEQTVYFLGGGMFQKSTNAGQSWDTIRIASNSYNKMTFPDINNGYAMITGSQPHKTTNGGLNWFQTTPLPPPSYSLLNMSFYNKDTGFITDGGYSRLFTTVNGGLNWSLVPGSYYNSCSFVHKNVGFLSYQTARRSTDFGNSWVDFTDKNNYTAAYFINSNTGFFTSDSGHIFKSTNGGTIKNKYSTSTGRKINCIDFVNSQTGYVCGDSGLVFKTTDTGNNWSAISMPSSANLNAIQFTDALTGFTAGATGALYKTTNSGMNWSALSGVTGNTKAMDFLNTSTGFISGDSGTILKTSNGGSNWFNFNISTTGAVNCIKYIDISTIYAAVGGQIYKSSNGGSNWINVFTTGTSNINSMCFPLPGTGYVCTDTGAVFRTTNSGSNWGGFNLEANRPLKSVFFISPDTGFACGTNGKIFKTINGGLVIGTNALSTNLPQDYKLSQNYPNPFNPTTNIKFDILKLSLVKLIIYDILGREISILVNQQLQPGAYEVEWDASSFPSGVYFYMLSTGEFVETKKMVLLK